MQLLHKNYFNFFLSLIVLLFCFITWTVAQTTFQKTYGGTADEDIGNLIVTPDGGYVAVGNSNSCTSGDNDICIFKTDSSGILQWARSFGDVGNDNGSTVIATENGYMVAGNLGVIGSNCDIFITRTDLEGKILWKKKYGGTGDDYVGVLQHTRDGNFIVAGGTTSYGAGGWDGFLMKIDNSGNVLWFKTYGTEYSDQTYRILEESNGDFVVTGLTYVPGNHDMLLFKTDSLGNLLWSKKYVLPYQELGAGLAKANNGDYLIVAESGPTTTDRAAVLYRIDSTGNILWTKEYRSPVTGRTFNAARSVATTSDGGIVIGGKWAGSGTDNNSSGFILKLDSIGNVLWCREYSGSNTEFTWSVDQTKDGGYILGGHTDNFGNGGKDCYLVKTDGNGMTSSGGTSVEPIVETPVVPVYDVVLSCSTYSLTGVEGQFMRENDACFDRSVHPPNSLVAYYPFNGNANDASGNGHNATFISATPTFDRFGKDSSAYSFNGTSNTIQCGDILDEVFCAPVAKFSITGWAKTRTCGNFTTGGGVIMCKSAGGLGPYQWSISHQEGLINIGVFSDEIAHNFLWLSNPMSINQWFQFALVFDGSLPEMQRLKLYVNGQSSNSSVHQHKGTLGTTTQNTTQNVCIGASHEFEYPQTQNSFYDGTVDDIHIYTKPLTQVEIDSLYHAGGWDTTNHAPVANAGPDQTIYTESTSGVLVNLNASLSSDIDGNTLTYTWKESSTLLTTGINPSILLSFGTHNITLLVDDGKGGIDSDMVIVTICHSTDGLAAYYPFNGNANDASGNGHNAIFINATPAFDRFGRDSSAYSFNGIDNYIDFGDILDSIFCKDTAQFSISGWAKTKVMGNVYGEGNLIIGKTAGGIGPYQWSISHNSGMLFGGVFSDSTVNNYQQKYVPMNANDWFHFVLIFDGKQSEENRIRVFVNNTSDMHYWSGSGTLGTSTKNTSLHMYVGGQTHYFQTLQSRYNGIIDDIRIYNRVLSSKEIRTLYLEGGWDTTNHAPVADAGPDQTVYADSLSSALVTLDGSASSDKDGDALIYTWKQADTTLATGVKPIVRLPLGSHTVTLIVADGKGGIDMDQVVFTVYSQLRVKVAFTLNVEGPIYAGISVLGDNAIYAIASGDAIYRMNTAGIVAYTIQVAGDIHSSSSIAYDTTMYIASSDRNLYAFSKDGNSLWPPLPTGGVLTATPTVDSIANRVYIGVSNHNFIAVNRSTGVVAWNYFADEQIWNSAVVTSDRKLIFATQRGTLYGFDLNNLTLPAAPSWQINLPDAAPSSIALDNQGYIYIGTGAGRLLKISLPANQQPSIVWQIQLGGAIIGSPVIDATGTLYVGSLDANLYAVDIQSGAVKWTFSTKGAIRSTPAISDAGNIYVANDNGDVISLDASKNILWYYKTSSAIAAPLLYYKSTLYIGTLENQVIALSDVVDSSQTSRLSKSYASLKITGKPVWATFQGNNQRTGIFSSSGTTGIRNSRSGFPIAYTLMQNYPNPFNPSTTIQFALPKDGRVSIKIFNMLGKHIATLVDGYQYAGYHEVTFNVGSFASGIYFYQMTAGSFVQTKKMLLMK